MSILTGRELEFLASLNGSWARLYRNELARLLHKVDDRCDAHHETRSIIRISAAPFLAFAPKFGDDDQDVTRGPLSDDHLPYPTRHQRSSVSSRC